MFIIEQWEVGKENSVVSWDNNIRICSWEKSGTIFCNLKEISATSHQLFYKTSPPLLVFLNLQFFFCSVSYFLESETINNSNHACLPRSSYGYKFFSLNFKTCSFFPFATLLGFFFCAVLWYRRIFFRLFVWPTLIIIPCSLY